MIDCVSKFELRKSLSGTNSTGNLNISFNFPNIIYIGSPSGFVFGYEIYHEKQKTEFKKFLNFDLRSIVAPAPSIVASRARSFLFQEKNRLVILLNTFVLLFDNTDIKHPLLLDQINVEALCIDFEVDLFPILSQPLIYVVTNKGLATIEILNGELNKLEIIHSDAFPADLNAGVFFVFTKKKRKEHCM